MKRKKLIAVIALVLLVFGGGIFAADRYSRMLRVSDDERWVELTVEDGNTHYAKAVYPADHEWKIYYGYAGADDDSDYIAIDLSDTTNYLHSSTNKIIIKSIQVNACTMTNAGQWQILFGTLVENDAENGSAHYFWSAYFGEGLAGVSAETICDSIETTPGVIYDLEIESNKHKYISVFPLNYITADGGYDNDDNWTTLMYTTVPPAPGDLLLKFDEQSGASSLKAGFTIVYRTE